MLPILQSFLPVFITLSTGVSVLLHEVQLEHAIAVAVPASISAGNISNSTLMLRDQHTHIERASMNRGSVRSSSAAPTIGPRISDDKKYIASKKLSIATSGSAYIWPSV